ncbi:MAG TPA: amino acid adenylation domain-containing protein [Longimicrobium sp.]|nr:amino acid adenylation domain-containing protein [Longimicrobium sp.]
MAESTLAAGEERRTMQDAWKDTARPLPPLCVHELVEAAARAHPGRTALKFEDATLSYAEMSARANRLARWLRRRGVGPETRVGVCAERSLELPVVLLAVLKAGGAYVPLDPAYPRERLANMVADGGVRLVVAQPHLADRVPDGVETVSLDAAETEAAVESADDFASGATQDNLAYVLFTSGSTGRPKGVMVSHRAVVRLVAQDDYCDFTPEETFLQFVPIAFDVSTFELWGPLSCGAKLVLFPPRTPSLDELGAFIRREAITTLWLTSGLFHPMVDSRPAVFQNVRRLLSGGDVLAAPQVRRVMELNPGLVMVNGYGPTEVTTFTTCHVMRSPDEAGDPVSIGRPIANTRCYVLDPALEPVAPGAAGELYAGGDGVARGYQGRPGLTAERFVPDPFSPVPGARLYRTGDQARWRPDGTLEFMGRIDQQVKVRGFRIELGEIESALASHEGVREAVVVAREDAPGADKRLVAYVVPTESGAPSDDLLRDHLRARLPEYMVPAAFVALDALPVTPNGKVDRRALPAPAASAETGRAGYVAPRTATEGVLAAIWAEVLGIERVGVHDDVFTLGGHSLASIRVASRIRDAFSVELPLPAVFENATVEALARAVEAGRAAGRALPPIARVPRDRRIPPALSQESVCFLQELSPGSRSYHFQAGLTFRGRLRVDVLERALTEIVRRHELLHTTFPRDAAGHYQRVETPWEVRIPTVDLTDVPASERPARARAWMQAHFGEPFDLSKLPLVRWTLLRMAPDEHVLVQVEHHLVHDGWSINVLLGELVRLYRAFVAGESSPLPELPVQFADYAAWQREWMASPGARAQLEHWKERLAGSSGVLELPTDRPRPAEQSFRGAAPRFRLPGALYHRLKALARREGATLYMTMLAAFDVLMARWSGQTDVVTATGTATRRLREVEGLIGMFVNVLPLRVDLSGDPTFAELVGRVRRSTLDAYAHQDVAFEAIVEAVAPPRDLSRNPLVQVGFSFHDAAIPDLALPDVKLELEVALSNGTSKFDMGIIVIPHAEQRLGREGDDDGFTIVWEHATDLFDAATIERMFAHFHALLEAAAADPEARISALPLLDAEARARMLALAAGEARAYDFDTPVHAHVERWARETPDALALRDGAGSLSYAALNERANRIARALRRMGVCEETTVALCVARGADLFAAQLGAMKAGAAFVPLEPSHPAERLRALLEESGAALVVTREADRGGLPGDGPRVLSLDGDALGIEGEDAGDLGVAVHPESLAYVIFTSGSTGRPKGVGVPHRALAGFVRAHQETFGIHAADRSSQVGQAIFDASVWEVWPCLAAGASVHVFDDETRAEPERLRARVLAEGITVVGYVPATLAPAFVAGPWPADAPLRWVHSGGDRMRARPPRGAPFRMANAYGPTETTVIAVTGEVAPADAEAGDPPLGGPLPNARAYVLDRALEPVPTGVPGEIHLGGPGVARGYLGRPAATAAAFVPDPFSARPGARMYRTGDRGRWRADGRLEFLGRADDQVKIRGIRVEPGEVESVLLAHPRVREAAVAARRDLPGGAARLVAYVVLDGEGDPAAARLPEHVRASLPAHMSPEAWVVLPALPRLATGKTDRAALPAPADGPSPFAAAYTAPRDATEAALADIWAAVLKKARVGVHDDFFVLGGHSLLATQVVSRVRGQLGVELPLKALFEAPTVAGMAAAVARAEAEAASELLAGLAGLSDDEVAALLAGAGDSAA